MVELTSPYDPFPPVFSVHTLTQAGFVLQWDADATGTIDPMTGTFDAFTPAFAWTEWRGTASADGNRIDGVRVDCHPGAPPTLLFETAYMRAIRQGLSVCGDKVRDPGEACDTGASNGLNNCCSADCTMIDEDADGICDDVDGCPHDNDPTRINVTCADVNPFDLQKFRVKPAAGSKGGLVKLSADLHGVSVAKIQSIVDFRVQDSNSSFPVDHTWSGFVCTAKSARQLICSLPDDTATLKLIRSTSRNKLRGSLRLSGLIVGLKPPVTVSFTDDSGLVRLIQLQTCDAGCNYP